MLVAFLCVCVTTLCALAGPLLVRRGIDQGIRAKDSDSLNNSVALYLIVAVVAYVFGRAQFLYLNRTGESFLRVLRLAVFRQMQRQSMAFYDRNKAGVLVARMTADIESMAELVQWGLMQFLSSFLLLFFAFFLLMSLSWELTLVSLIVFPFLIFIYVVVHAGLRGPDLDWKDRCHRGRYLRSFAK